MKKYLETGKITSIHGIKGEVKILPWSDNAQLLTELPFLYLQNGDKTLIIEHARVHKNMAIVKFKGVDSPEQAQKYRNQILYLDRDDMILDENEFFIQDLIGLSVYDADDSFLCYGIIVDITQTGANDVYHIKDDQNVLRLIPAIPEVLINIDLQNQSIFIRPLQGLFDNAD